MDIIGGQMMQVAEIVNFITSLEHQKPTILMATESGLIMIKWDILLKEIFGQLIIMKIQMEKLKSTHKHG